jgi:hypothetical protein
MNNTIQNIAGLSVFIELRTLADQCANANIFLLYGRTNLDFSSL